MPVKREKIKIKYNLEPQLEQLLSKCPDQPPLFLPHYNVGLNSNITQTVFHGMGGERAFFYM